MTALENIKIFAYLSPHPLDEDTELEEDWIDWIPGYLKGESEYGGPSYFREENIALFDKVEELSAEVFRKALQRMFPLLREFQFQNIQLSIDFLNYKNSQTSLAGYNHHYSNPAKGVYVFHVDQQLLNRYLHFLNGNQEAIPDMNIWEHEIVHLIDHWQLVKASTFAHSDVTLNNLHYYLLKYREEGLANLFDLLDGKQNHIKSIQEAKEKFKSNYGIAKGRLQVLEKTNDQIRKEVYAGYDFYEIGPWLILDMLDEILFTFDSDDNAKSLEQKIANGIIIEDDKKLEILKLALMIDNEWFLERVLN